MKKYLNSDNRTQNSTLHQKLLHYRYIKKTPRVLPRIINAIIRRRILGQKRLRTMELAITYNCNFRCPFCSAKFLGRDLQYMKLEQIKKFWSEIIDLGIIHVDLTGGEPTLIRDDKLCEIIDYLSWNRAVMVTIATNGFLITKENSKNTKEWV